MIKTKDWPKALEILVLAAISALLIFYKFGQIPHNLAYDEVDIAKLALSLEHQQYTPFSPLADGHGTVYPYILLSSMKLFGVNTFALRLPSAIFGVINVLLLYLIIRLLFERYNRYLPFASAFILATSRWFFNFPRFSFEMPFLLFLELGAIYFLLSCFKNKSIWLLVLSGIMSGLAFNSYQPGRIFFILPLLFIVLKKEKIKSYLFFIVPFILVITPMSLYLLMHNQNDIRINNELFLKNSQLSITQKVQFLADNLRKFALMFNFNGDSNGRHNYPYKPALNPILGILFLGGLLFAIKNLSNIYNQFFLAYFVVAGLPAILTYPWENPNMLRTYTLLPSLIYFVSQSLLFLSNLKINHKKVLFSIVLLLILISSIYEVRTYFVYQSEVVKHAFEIFCPLNKVVKLNPNQIIKQCKIK